MQNGLLLLLLIIISCSGCAQRKVSRTQNVQAYFSVRLSGTIAVDPETGEPQPAVADTNWQFYSTLTEANLFSKVRINGKVYSLKATRLESPVVIGINKLSGESVSIEAGKSNPVFRLTPTLLLEKTISAGTINNVELTGKRADFIISGIPSLVIELQLPPTQ